MRVPSSSPTSQIWVKLKAPASKGQEHMRGALADLQSPSTARTKFEDILQMMSSNAMSFETKQSVLKRAVSQCLSMSIGLLGLKVPSLLDSDSIVILICEGNFTKNILPLLHGLASDLTEAHSFFGYPLLTAKSCHSRYFEADVTLLGFTIPHVGFLVVQDPKTCLEPKHRFIGCNLIQLGCEKFGKVYGFDAFKTFHCPDSVHPLVFAQMCSFYHQGKLSTQTTSNNSQPTNSAINANTLGVTSEAKKKSLVQAWKQYLGKSG